MSHRQMALFWNSFSYALREELLHDSMYTYRCKQWRNSCRWWLKNFHEFSNLNWLQRLGKEESRLWWTHVLSQVTNSWHLYLYITSGQRYKAHVCLCLPAQWTIRSQKSGKNTHQFVKIYVCYLRNEYSYHQSTSKYFNFSMKQTYVMIITFWSWSNGRL